MREFIVLTEIAADGKGSAVLLPVRRLLVAIRTDRHTTVLAFVEGGSDIEVAETPEQIRDQIDGKDPKPLDVKIGNMVVGQIE